MTDTYLKKSDLIKGKKYKCQARNFSIGEWDGEHFIYLRSKWGTTYPDKEYHYDDGPPYGTVKPLGVYNGEFDHMQTPESKQAVIDFFDNEDIEWEEIDD